MSELLQPGCCCCGCDGGSGSGGGGGGSGDSLLIQIHLKAG